MPYTASGGVRIYWDETGSGTPVLLVMGASYSSAMWYPVIDALAAHHRVIWFDNRGVGRSQATKTGSIADMAADAVAVLDAAGADKAHIYGVSLGGVVVLQLGLQNPERVRSLILGCTGILSDNKPRAPKFINAIAYIPAVIRRTVLGRSGASGYGSAATVGAVTKDLEMIRADRNTPTGLIQQQNALRAYSVSPDCVRQIRLPAIVIHGTEDKMVPYAYGQELTETIEGSQFLSLDGAGHNYLIAQGERANKAVLDFMAATDRAPESVDV